MQLECLSTNRNHLARVQVFVVLCPISPYFIIALPHFSQRVYVTFGNFASVTIMSNKVFAFKFSFERAGPHLTESNDLSKCSSGQLHTVWQKDCYSHLCGINKQNKSHEYARIKLKADQRGPKWFLRNKAKKNDWQSVESQWMGCEPPNRIAPPPNLTILWIQLFGTGPFSPSSNST